MSLLQQKLTAGKYISVDRSYSVGGDNLKKFTVATSACFTLLVLGEMYEKYEQRGVL